MLIREIGPEGQERLKEAKIVIAGVGGLGSAVALYLVAAGVGTVRLIDPDTIELSNLNRQVLHWTDDLGRRKVLSAAEKLKRLNPRADIEAIDQPLTEENIPALISGFDLVVDALDNLPDRLLLNQAILVHGLPLFHGAVRAFEGRVMSVIPGRTACLKCVYHGARPEEQLPVIGAIAAVVGSLQATEVIKHILGIGRLLIDRCVLFDGLNMRFTELMLKRDPHCPDCGTLERQAES
jgi:molybdopterin/thiamine biosynthesis adenylyltransferase